MAIKVSLPKLTYEMEEGHILEWLCKEGDECAVGQPLFVVETDKAAVEVPAEHAGTLLKILIPAGETVPVGKALAWIGSLGEIIQEHEPDSSLPPYTTPAPGEAPHPPSTATEAAQAVRPPTTTTQAVAASPVAKRLARELGVDLAEVQRQVGPKRIREDDVRTYFDRQKIALAGQATEVGDSEFQLLEITPLQRAMATHLSQAASIPQSAAVCEVDLTNLKRLRSEMLDSWEAAHGFRLSYTHMLAALAVRALEESPRLNASWTEEGIRLYRSVNLGVAMASERGLVVPVVRNAQGLTLFELAAEIVRLQRAAESNRLPPGDLDGGTFTMTNVGMLEISLSIPLLNPPQSAILGIGAERNQVVLQDNTLRVAPVVWLTVVTDHRVVDGAAAGRFLGRLKALVEDPRVALDR